MGNIDYKGEPDLGRRMPSKKKSTYPEEDSTATPAKRERNSCHALAAKVYQARDGFSC